MTRLFTFSLLLTTGLLYAQPQPKIWRTFKPDGGQFEVLSPDAMQHKVDSVTTPLGQLAYHTYFHQPPESEAMAENLMYMVSYCDYPEGTLHQDSAGLLLEFFTATMESAAAAVNGETVYHAERNYKSYPGHFWRIDYLEGQAVIKTWGIVVEHRYYAVQTVTVKKRSLNRSSDNFLDSFQIIPAEGKE